MACECDGPFSHFDLCSYQDSVLEAFAATLPPDSPTSAQVNAELTYPNLPEPSPTLQRACSHARTAGGGRGLDAIVAARDFMSFPVKLRRPGAPTE